jgi:hypothetical protein
MRATGGGEGEGEVILRAPGVTASGVCWVIWYQAHVLRAVHHDRGRLCFSRCLTCVVVGVVRRRRQCAPQPLAVCGSCL